MMDKQLDRDTLLKFKEWMTSASPRGMTNAETSEIVLALIDEKLTRPEAAHGNNGREIIHVADFDYRGNGYRVEISKEISVTPKTQAADVQDAVEQCMNALESDYLESDGEWSNYCFPTSAIHTMLHSLRQAQKGG